MSALTSLSSPGGEPGPPVAILGDAPHHAATETAQRPRSTPSIASGISPTSSCSINAAAVADLVLRGLTLLPGGLAPRRVELSLEAPALLSQPGGRFASEWVAGIVGIRI